MPIDQFLAEFFGQNILYLLLAVFIVVCVMAGVRIVPQSEKFVVERLGRLQSVLGPGINFIVPFLDRVPPSGVDPRTAIAADDAGCDHF